MQRRPLTTPLTLILTLTLLISSTHAQSTNSTTSTTSQSKATNGATSNRLSLPSLFFSLPLLPLGIYLLLFGRRFRRVTCAIGLGNALALAAWSGCVNLVGVGGVTGSGSSEWEQGMGVWGITAGFWILGVLMGASPRYGMYAGWCFIGCEGGLALGFCIQLLGNDLTIHSAAARWAIIGLLFVLALMSVILTKVRGVILCTALSGGFLLMLGIDILVNANKGMAKGLSVLIDHNDHHSQDLANWVPPLSSRVLAAASWLMALLGAIFQLVVFQGPFLPPHLGLAVGGSTSDHKSDHHPGPNGAPTSSDLEASNGPYNRQNSTTPGSSAGEMAEGVGAAAGLGGLLAGGKLRKNRRGSGEETLDGDRTVTDSGLSAIAEQTERSRESGGAFAVERGGRVGPDGSAAGYALENRREYAGSPNPLYNTTYPADYDPSHFPSPYDTVPTSTPYNHATTGWEALGLADPNLPSTPPATVISDSTLFPGDSASQVGWRRLQAEQHAAYLQNGPRTEVSDDEGTRIVPITTTPSPPAGAPLRVTNGAATASTSTPFPVAGAKATTPQSGWSESHTSPQPGSQATPPPPFTSGVDSESSPTASGGPASGVGRPMRVFWALTGKGRRNKKSVPPRTASDDASVPLAQPAPTHDLRRSFDASASPPPTHPAIPAHLNVPGTAIGTETASVSARGRAGTVVGTGVGSTMMTEPTAPMAPFLRPERQMEMSEAR